MFCKSVLKKTRACTATALTSLFLIVTLAFSILSSSLFLNGELLEAIAPTASAGSHGVVIVDAGHGGEDCGAIGINGCYEKDLNLEISRTLGEYLRRAGYTVVYTRTEDRLLYSEDQNIKGFRKIYDLKNRVAVADEYPSALFISIHMNSFGKEKYSGLQVYYSTGNEESKRLADSIQSEAKERTQPENTRVPKPGRDIYVMENIENVGVLVECGFLSNAEECQKLSEKEYQKELCFAILCGIISYSEDI